MTRRQRRIRRLKQIGYAVLFVLAGCSALPLTILIINSF